MRTLRAALAAALVGGCMLGLVKYVALPALERGLSASQTEWLRRAFQFHPVLFLAAMVAVVAVLGLPVLLAAMWAARPSPRGRR